MKINAKIIKCLSIIQVFLLMGMMLASCSAETKHEGRGFKVSRDYACAEFLEALGNEHYYLDISLYSNGIIIYNTIAMSNGVIESRSSVDGRESHTYSENGKTYFLDDKNKVYFLSSAGADDGLRSVVDYSTARFVKSGTKTLSFGSDCFYEEFTCKTYDGAEIGVRFFTSDGNFIAIEDFSGDQSIERDVAEFSREIPDGWLEIPADYTLIDEDTFFEEYYGK